ncbi:MAG: ribosomal-protein-alanine N-acetyltransferase [Gammaproteobacteria bacterium]|nr:MAG: ribosomal-protein-alanine N-acetyltransferase [Gammaproteobacteria bacterium]
MSAVSPLPAYLFSDMEEEDLPQVLAIDAEAYEFPWSRRIFLDCLEAGYHCRVFKQWQTILAYGVMSVAASEAHILNLCVRPAYQRRGLGRRMLAHLLDIARREGAEIVLLEARISNKVAIHLYTRMGFREVGMRKNYYPSRGGREDAVVLMRSF